MKTADQPEIVVAAGILTDATGKILISRRPEGAHMAGWWEFPGGKLDDDETLLDGLTRELREELGIEVHSAEPLLSYRHDYPERVVYLHAWRVTGFTGAPAGLEGQALRWAAVDRLMEIGLLPADLPIVAALQSMA